VDTGVFNIHIHLRF